METTEVLKEKKSNKKWILILCIILAAVLLAAAGKWIYDRYQMNQNGTPAYSQDAVDWDGSFGEEAAEEGMITIPGYDTVPLKAGSDTAKIVLANPDTNECLFQFELILKDTDEILYTSDMVMPGKAIMSQQLNRTLEAGEYNLIIRINTFSMDGKTSYNGSDIEVPLHVYEE